MFPQGMPLSFWVIGSTLFFVLSVHAWRDKIPLIREKGGWLLLLAALVAFVWVIHTPSHYTHYKEFQKATIKTPYFVRISTKVETSSENRCTLIISAENNEVEARNITTRLIVFKEPSYDEEKSEANPIGPNTILKRSWDFDINPDMPGFYVAFKISYSDDSGNELPPQIRYFKFSGTDSNGNYHDILLNITLDEKTKIEEHMKEQGIPQLEN